MIKMTHSWLATQQQNIVRLCPSDSVKGDGTAATNTGSQVHRNKASAECRDNYSAHRWWVNCYTWLSLGTPQPNQEPPRSTEQPNHQRPVYPLPYCCIMNGPFLCAFNVPIKELSCNGWFGKQSGKGHQGVLGVLTSQEWVQESR